jgi:Ca2+-binding RTX toxin-like protein
VLVAKPADRLLVNCNLHKHRPTGIQSRGFPVATILGSPEVAHKYSTIGNSYENIGVLHDFNGDGRIDYLALYNSFDANWHVAPHDSAMRVFLGDGRGGFTLGTAALFQGAVPGTNASTNAILSDFNGDNRLDVFISDQGYDDLPFPGHLNILLLAGKSGSTLIPTPLPGTPVDFSSDSAAADIDGDGDTDIFICNFGGSGAQIAPYFLLNNGTATFSIDYERVPYPQNGSSDYRYVVSEFYDVDLDGDPDLILGTAGRLNKDSVILYNDGRGEFSNSRVLPMAPDFSPPASEVQTTTANDIDIADVNGDGRPDILVSYISGFLLGGYLQINIQRADGSFLNETQDRLPQTVDANDSALWDTVATDMDADGDLDLVLLYQDHIELHTNDGSGRFKLSDTIDQWTVGAAVADINGDALPDIVWCGPSVKPDEQYLWVSINSYRSGKDKLNGNGGDDVLKGFGGNDALKGRGGSDMLLGGFGNDSLNGGKGNDVLAGQLGADRLKGGSGADNFIFELTSDSTAKAKGRDIILDFKRKQGDKIDLSAIDPLNDTGTFAFIGRQKFEKEAGELRYVKKAGETLISGDVDGDGRADFSIALATAMKLLADDFYL